MRGTREKPFTDLLLPLLLGAAAFHLLAGWKILLPTNVAWLVDVDGLTHYLGWAFFRNDAWRIPLGANPDYGLELGSSIVFSDSLPLFAVPLKAISGLLPQPFQYTGAWLLACCLAQAWFAWKLVGLVSSSAWVRFFASGLFLFSPPLMLRMSGHFTLVAHFVILAALYLSLRPRSKRRVASWAVLLGVAAAIHPYLLFMTGSLWAADLAGSLLVEPNLRRGRALVVELAIVPGVAILVCWQVGYFMVGDSVAAIGFGFYRMNLLSLVDPNGWSTVLGDRPGGAGDYEGFSYLGLGGLFLALFALPSLVLRPERLRRMLSYRPILVLLLVLLTAMALSSHVGIGTNDYVVDLPWRVNQMLNVFRASGRMFWPVFYVILLAIVFVLVRAHGAKVAASLLGIAFVMQVVDTRPGWIITHDQYAAAPNRSIGSPLVDPFWTAAAGRYRTVRMLMPANLQRNWRVFAVYASEHRLKTDAVYLARVSEKRLAELRVEDARIMTRGQYDPDTLYVVESDQVPQAWRHVDRAKDLIARVDGYVVVAPGWKSCADCMRVTGELSDAGPPGPPTGR